MVLLPGGSEPSRAKSWSPNCAESNRLEHVAPVEVNPLLVPSRVVLSRTTVRDGHLNRPEVALIEIDGSRVRWSEGGGGPDADDQSVLEGDLGTEGQGVVGCAGSATCGRRVDVHIDGVIDGADAAEKTTITRTAMTIPTIPRTRPAIPMPRPRRLTPSAVAVGDRAEDDRESSENEGHDVHDRDERRQHRQDPKDQRSDGKPTHGHHGARTRWRGHGLLCAVVGRHLIGHESAPPPKLLRGTLLRLAPASRGVQGSLGPRCL